MLNDAVSYSRVKCLYCNDIRIFLRTISRASITRRIYIMKGRLSRGGSDFFCPQIFDIRLSDIRLSDIRYAILPRWRGIKGVDLWDMRLSDVRFSPAGGGLRGWIWDPRYALYERETHHKPQNSQFSILYKLPRRLAPALLQNLKGIILRTGG